jgi:Protein of unknown function (DUF4229)
MAIEKFPYLGLTEPAMPAGCPDTANAPRCRPPCNSLGVHSKECGDFPRREQALTGAVHDFSLVPKGLSQVSQKLAKLATNGSFIPRFGKISSERSVSHVRVPGRAAPQAGRSANRTRATCTKLGFTMRATLSYTLLRLLIFFAAVLVLGLCGMRGFWLLVSGAAISALVSFPLLSRFRDRMSSSLTGRLDGFKSKLDAGAGAEDGD